MSDLSFSVIIPAAGTGTRTGETIPKQWIDIGGEPMVIRSLRIFEGLEGLKSVIVALHPEERDQRKAQLTAAGLNLNLKFCSGGKRRQDTVASALDALNASDEEIIVIHDAARPFASRDLVLNVVKKAWEGQAAIAAVPVVDTIKEIDRVGYIINTPRRTRLRRAQTPQAVRAGILKRGLALAAQREIELTDDAIAAELMGFRVAIVSGEENNFKITTARDFAWVRFLMERGDL